jgi:hypothetical protein
MKTIFEPFWIILRTIFELLWPPVLIAFTCLAWLIPFCLAMWLESNWWFLGYIPVAWFYGKALKPL